MTSARPPRWPAPGRVISGCHRRQSAGRPGRQLPGRAWDQNAVFHVASPTAACLEDVCRRWLLALFGLPPDAGIGFVTGATMANFSALAAARHALLDRRGWDVEAQGLFGAPQIKVIVARKCTSACSRP